MPPTAPPKPQPTWCWTFPGMSRCFSGQKIPVYHHPHSKEFILNIYYKPTPFWFKDIPPCPITVSFCKKSLCSSLAPFRCWKAVQSLLQAEQPLSACLHIEVLQPSDDFHSPPLHLVQQIHVLLTLGAQELNMLLLVGIQRAEVEGWNHLL